MKVRFIGLGRMGHVMWRRLLDGGHEVAVYNRTPEKTKSLVELAATATKSSQQEAKVRRPIYFSRAPTPSLCTPGRRRQSSNIGDVADWAGSTGWPHRYLVERLSKYRLGSCQRNARSREPENHRSPCLAMDFTRGTL